MVTPPIDIYTAAFGARSDATRGPGSRRVGEPGVHGVVSPPGSLTRLLVTDDRAFDVLVDLLPGIEAGSISVLAPARRCTALLGEQPAWRAKEATAMIARDLSTVPDLPLPGGLTLRPVRRLPDDASDGVPLVEAVAVAMLADASGDEPDELATYLSVLPPAIRLFAALDRDDAVRATSGSGAFGAQASVLFVNTDPGWQRRGAGAAMTAAALRAARAAGARLACLDASDIALSIYRRLAFEVVDRTTQFVRTPANPRGQ